MSKKDVHPVVSGAGWIGSFAGALVNGLEEIGISFEDIHKLNGNTKEGKALVQICVEKVAEAVKRVKNALLANFIAPLHFDYINPNITEENFPPQPEDPVSEKEYKVFSLGKTISSANAIAEMGADGFRPATLREQLIWAVKNWNGRDWVVALGSAWRNPDGRLRVSLLNGDVSRRKLDLCWFEYDWSEGYRFLAVRK